MLTSGTFERPRAATPWPRSLLVVIVVVTATVAAWASIEQAQLAQQAGLSADQRSHSRLLQAEMLASIVIALSIVSGLWWAAHTQRVRLSWVAHRDALTGLLNRRAFYSHGEHELAGGDSDSPEVTVVMLDLDGFKDVNDTCGHHVGDLLLVEVS